jgi:hypothetical protein
MGRYSVKVRGALPGREVPALLSELGDFVATLERGELGYFDRLEPTELGDSWSKDPARLRAAGFGFLGLGDGSELALLDLNGVRPVVLLDSEGDARTIASSLEGFLFAWAKAATDVGDLDDAPGTGRKALAAWLKQHGLKAPKKQPAAAFDFQAWLDGGDGFEKPNVGQLSWPTCRCRFSIVRTAVDRRRVAELEHECRPLVDCQLLI